ncbi:MAG: DNA topoisomerase 3 [Bacteroidales bacterium]|nr:DNA topoisomerase 3 [Bacteroidales bacterium]
MIVCIAEKPSVARDIAKILGANTSKEGYMEGNGYQVTWTYGHLCTLKEPADYSVWWKNWEMEQLPMIPDRFGIKLISNATYEKQFHIIEKLFLAADSIVNCGDAGQEGELIQRWVLQKTGARCPVQRLWISSLTEESIREGFKNLKPQEEYLSLYQAGLCRAIGDWLLGMNATRLYTLKYRTERGQVLSIGRVQTPTLALIVSRQLEIQNFKPEQYWVLSTVYRDTLFTLQQNENEDDDSDDGTAKKKGAKGRITNEEEGRRALQSIEGQDFEITGIAKKGSDEAPPRLFDLTSLQVECNKKFSFSADETLKYIQSLYEKKLTTYPRVDTTYLSDDIYPKCPSILQGLLPYASLTQPLLQSKLPKSKKVFDSSKVTDHHAIIPTGVNPSNGDLTLNEKKVFDLVARHFIAVFYPACKVSTTTVTGKVQCKPEESKKKGEKLTFKANGKQILAPGWRVCFGRWVEENGSWHQEKKNTPIASDDGEEKKEDDKMLPAFTKGESGPHTPTLTEKWTTPPKPYTEATLLRAMETAGRFVDNDELRDALKENGIGRPSTRAAIIETLFKRGYIRKVRKSLAATETGVNLIALIQNELLKSAELTGQWEKKLREIEAHQYDPQQFLAELKQMVTDIVFQVRGNK